MYGITSAGVGVEGVLLCGSFYMCPTVSVYLSGKCVDSTLHEAVSGEMICKPIHTLQH